MPCTDCEAGSGATELVGILFHSIPYQEKRRDIG
jgi:hypothetical protein